MLRPDALGRRGVAARRSYICVDRSRSSRRVLSLSLLPLIASEVPHNLHTHLAARVLVGMEQVVGVKVDELDLHHGGR